jgi:hypothetical protein
MYDPRKGARNPGFQEAFVRACLHLLRDPEAWAAASAAGREASRVLDWDGVAAEWESLVGALLNEEALAHA